MNKFKVIFVLIASVFFSCGDDYERIVISTYPDETPLQVGVYEWKGNKQVMIKEINYFPNGEIETEGELNEKGQKDGYWVHWYNNGKKWLEENYKDGVLDGEFIEWYMSGDKSFEGEYENGIPSGKWTFWDEDGDKISRITYENGIVVDQKNY